MADYDSLTLTGKPISSSYQNLLLYVSSSILVKADGNTFQNLSNYTLKSGDTMSGALCFTGSNHFGIKVNNLSTTQRDAVGENYAGNIIWNSTTEKYDFAGGSYVWFNYVRTDGDTMTGALTVSSSIIAYRFECEEEALTYASSSALDFNTYSWKTITLGGDVVFTTTNKAKRREVSVKILCDGTGRNFTFPSWIFVGGAAPTSIAANKTAILSLRCFGTNDTDIVASYAVQS